MAELWLRELKKGLPEGETLRILDVGTGCGFFSVLLAKLGHQVTGIDLTPAMIEKAKMIADERDVQADFEVMDAEHPGFSRWHVRRDCFPESDLDPAPPGGGIRRVAAGTERRWCDSEF